MFWRFGGYANISSLDNILDKPDVSLEELLDESDLIQELKQQNSKLIEFLREEATLGKLLKYVISEKEAPPAAKHPDTIEEEGDSGTRSPRSPARSEKGKRKDGEKSSKISFFGRSRSRSKSVSKTDADGEEDKQEAKRRKYAYIATEVLSSEVWSLTEAMFEYQTHLREFWEYLRRPAPLDPVQAGYFTKVNDTLLDKKTEDMFTFLKSLDGIVPEMLKHVDCPMVMDLLLKMISLEKSEGGQGIVDWLQAQGLIPILLSYLGPDNSVATQTAAGDFLKAIITISANATGQDQTVIGPNELTRQLVSEKCVTKLIDDMLTGGNPLTVGVGIIIEVIRKNNSDYDLEGQVIPEPRTTDPIYLGTLLHEFAKKIPDFMALVRNPQANKPPLQVASGEKIQPLGFDRFKTCELMAELLHCSNMGLLNERGAHAELKARDAERERLKAEGNLQSTRLGTPTTDEPFASSVDSHGFHHARAPDDDFNESPERVSRLEVQNAPDEDGFEKVAVSDADPLPDEVTFDDFKLKPTDEDLPPPPLKLAKGSGRADGEGETEHSDEHQDQPDTPPQEKRRVSLLTKQIQDHIDDTVSDDQDQAPSVQPLSPGEQSGSGVRLGDKPAPLFASKSSPSKGTDPILGDESPREDAEPGTHSIATLLPESQDGSEPSNQLYEAEADGSPVIGDFLKIQFVDHEIVPTILDFFFRFPWNNFLHNVVYDVVQQVFNGTLDRGYNRTLAQNLFSPSKCDVLVSNNEITQRILDGQANSDKSQAERGMRLGYMGHLTLIAEEVCKFAERHPAELLGDNVMERVLAQPWITYVEGILSDTRDRDNAVLGGVRPEQSMSLRSLGGGSLLSQGSFGNSNALVNAGLVAPSDSLALQDEAGTFEDGGRGGLLGGFGDGDDDDLDEDGHERSRAIDDDEQNFSLSDDFADTNTSPSSTAQAPPPLNIPPSRARRQLAARLAQRRREAQEAAASNLGGDGTMFTRGRSSSSSGQSSTSSEDELDLLAHGTVGGEEGEESDEDEDDDDVHEEIDLGGGGLPGGHRGRGDGPDPDAEDSTALHITSHLATTEPVGNDTAASVTKVTPSAAAATTAAAASTQHPQPLFGGASTPSAAVPRHSSFDDDDDDDTDSSGLSDDDDDDEDEGVITMAVRRRPAPPQGDVFPRFGSSTGLSSGGGEQSAAAAAPGKQPSPSEDDDEARRVADKEERKRRRPSTTEAKIRRPIEEGSDDDGDGDGDGTSDDADEDLAVRGKSSGAQRAAQARSEDQSQSQSHTQQPQQGQGQKRRSGPGHDQLKSGGGYVWPSRASSSDDTDGGDGDSEDDIIEIKPRRPAA